MDVTIFTFVLPSLIAALAHHDWASRPTRILNSRNLVRWRMARRNAGRSLRSCQNSPIHNRLVCPVHVSQWICSIVWTAPCHSRTAGSRIRWRVGGGLGPDGRNDSRRASRQSRWRSAVGLGSRMGNRGSLLRHFLFDTSNGEGLESDVLGWNLAGSLDLLYSRPHRRARDLPSKPPAIARRFSPNVRLPTPFHDRSCFVASLLEPRAATTRS